MTPPSSPPRALSPYVRSSYKVPESETLITGLGTKGSSIHGLTRVKLLELLGKGEGVDNVFVY